VLATAYGLRGRWEPHNKYVICIRPVAQMLMLFMICDDSLRFIESVLFSKCLNQAHSLSLVTQRDNVTGSALPADPLKSGGIRFHICFTK
jgi:hypothetical protein